MAVPESAWHLDKRVPITLIGTILIQTFVVGRWAAMVQRRIEAQERRIAAIRAKDIGW